MTIELVLFDFGGVIADEGFVGGLEAIARKQNMPPSLVSEQALEIIFSNGFIVGQCDEASFWRDVRSRLGIQGSDAELRTEILDRFVLRPWMLDIVRQLRKSGIRVAILSDQVNWLDELDASLHFSSEFEHVFNSFKYGAHKGEERFFQLALDELQVAPGKTLFIDDAVRNIAVATSLGIRTILYTNHENFLEQFETFFREV